MFRVEGTNILIPEEAVYKYLKARQKMKPNVTLIGGPFPGCATGQTVFNEGRDEGFRRTHLYDKATGRYLGATAWMEAKQAPLPYPGFNRRKIVRYPAPILSPTEAAFAKRIREE